MTVRVLPRIGSHSFTSDSTKKRAKIPNRPQTESRRSRKNVETLVWPRNGMLGLSHRDGDRDNRIRRDCQGGHPKFVPSQSHTGSELIATEKAYTSRHPGPLLRGRALIRAARYLAQTSVKGPMTARPKGHHQKASDYRDRQHYAAKASLAGRGDSSK